MTETPRTNDDVVEAGTLLDRIQRREAKVVIVGQGYVGLPVAMRASEVGFETVGFEVDPGRVASLAAGTSYIGDVSDVDLQRALAAGYVPTDQIGDLAGFDIAIITVPTPLRDGVPDLSHVEAAARALVRVLRADTLVVLESTSYPGTTEEFLGPILEESGLRAGTDFHLGYSPERIDPGNPHFAFTNTPKIVSGSGDTARKVVAAFYGSLVDELVPVGSCAEAELVKVLENTYRHVNIALINELAMFSRDLGVDIWSAIDAAATKPFGYTPFRPGPGVGGHCLPIDPSYLSWRVRQNLGHTFRFVELANDVNEHMPDYVVTRLVGLLNEQERPVKNTRILLLGMAYKASTSDWRESPSLEVAQKLSALGATLSYCDPHLPDAVDLGVDLTRVGFSADVLCEHDLVVVLVDHPEFEPRTVAGSSPLVFDAKGWLRGLDFEGETL